MKSAEYFIKASNEGYGEAHEEAGKACSSSQAIPYFEKMSNKVRGLYYISKCYENLGKTEEANNFFLKAEEIAKHENNYENLSFLGGQLYWDLDDKVYNTELKKQEKVEDELSNKFETAVELLEKGWNKGEGFLDYGSTYVRALEYASKRAVNAVGLFSRSQHKASIKKLLSSRIEIMKGVYEKLKQDERFDTFLQGVLERIETVKSILKTVEKEW